MAENTPKVSIENECQDAEPFEDDIMLESPSGQSQLENLNAETEILDIDIDKEVVMDSDDEGIQRTEEVRLMNELPSDETRRSLRRNQVGLEKRHLDLAANQSYVGYFRGQGSKARSSSTDKGSEAGPSSIYVEASRRKQHRSNGNEDGVECQLAVHGNVKEGAVGNINWDCNGKSSAFMDEFRRMDMARNVITGDAHVVKEVPSDNCEAMDGQKDYLMVNDVHEFAELSYIDSQEPGELSETDALGIVDHYLSIADVNFSPEVERRKVNRIVSPPPLCGKGPQALAKRATLGTTAGDSGRFDWSGNEADDHVGDFLRKRNKGFSLWKGHVPKPGNRSQVNGTLNVQKENDFSIVKLQGEIANNQHNDSTALLINENDCIQMVETAAMKTETETDTVSGLDKQFGVTSLGQQSKKDSGETDASSMFDVGLDTQMAAEAMEALLYALPPNNNVTAPQYLEKDFPKGQMMTKASKCNSIHEGAGSEVVKPSKRTVRPRGKLKRKRSGSSQVDASGNKLDLDLPMKRKLVRGMRLTERENIKEVSRNGTSLKSVNRGSQNKGESRGKLKSSLANANQTQYSSELSSKINDATDNPPCTSGERMNSNVQKVDFLKRGRKRKKLLSVGSNTYCEVTNSNMNHQEQTDPHVPAITSQLKLDFWMHPKKKRTQTVPHHLKGAINSCAPCTTIHGRHGNMQSVRIHQKSEGDSSDAHFILHVNRKARSTRQLKFSSQKEYVESISRQNSGETDMVDVICDPAFVDGQMNHIKSNAVNATCQYGKLDADLISPVYGLGESTDSSGKNSKLEQLPNADHSSSPVYRGTKKAKQLLKKSSLRSLLMKELSRLGFSESLPEFASKDLRRRRNMANIKVLFSQSLDDCIIKQQRKILARLGISVASCCWEATHFVTDRFVRTRNMLEAIALGKPVVTHLWLESCAQVSCLIDEKKYILRDVKKEKEIGFSMSVSLARARQHPLLKGRSVFITHNIKPCKEMIESLVKAVNGQVVANIQRVETRDNMILDDLLVLSCEEDYDICVPFLEKGVGVYSSELLLNGIVTQKLDLSRHQLFKDYHKRNCSIVYTRRGKNRSFPATK